MVLEGEGGRREGNQGRGKTVVYIYIYVYYCRTYEKAVSGGGEREKGGLGHVLRTPLAAACASESRHLTLVSGAGAGEVVSKKAGKEVRGAQG